MNFEDLKISHLSPAEIQYLFQNILKESSVVAGENHPADDLINLIVKYHPNHTEVFYYLIHSNPIFRSDIFKLISRLESKYFDNLSFHGLLRNFLKDENIEVVDSVIGIFESISSKKILKDWLETNPNHPQWLLDYAKQVINQDSSL